MSDSERKIETMTVDDLVEWLRGHGIPEVFCCTFKGQSDVKPVAFFNRGTVVRA